MALSGLLWPWDIGINEITTERLSRTTRGWRGSLDLATSVVIMVMKVLDENDSSWRCYDMNDCIIISSLHYYHLLHYCIELVIVTIIVNESVQLQSHCFVWSHRKPEKSTYSNCGCLYLLAAFRAWLVGFPRLIFDPCGVPALLEDLVLDRILSFITDPAHCSVLRYIFDNRQVGVWLHKVENVGKKET